MVTRRRGAKAHLLALMQEEASRGGGVSTRSDGNHARMLGVCRQTIRRWKCQFEAEGLVHRDGYHYWNPRCKTVRYRLDVTQGSNPKTTGAGFRSSWAYSQSSKVHSGTCSGRARASRGRRRQLMEKHPEKIAVTGIARKDGSVTPFNAGDAMAIVCEFYDGPIPRQFRARMGKAAKELLEDGFDPATVVAAMQAGLQRARVDLIPTLALEIQLARGGQWLSWDKYRRALEHVNRENQSEDDIKRALREAFKP